MGLFDVTQISLERALAGSTLRQEVLANNVSNANTPGFRRADVDFHTALAEALDAGAERKQLEQLAFEPETDPSGPSRSDGGNVDMDVEMASLAENALEHQALVNVAKARLRMLELVIGPTR